MTTPNVWKRHDLLFREEVVCENPLLSVDRQIGLNIVHSNGKVPKKHFLGCSGSDYLLLYFRVYIVEGRRKQAVVAIYVWI